MRIPLDQIDLVEDGVRQTAAGDAADAALRASISELGVLTPILAHQVGNRYAVIDGARRVQAARLLSLPDIAAELLPDHAEGWGTAASAAANLVRAPMQPLDRWRVMRRLQDQGYTLQGAAAALGLTQREAGKLDRLSRLHKSVLTQLAAGDWPPDHILAVIAGAKPADQARAVAAHKGGKPPTVSWFAVMQALKQTRIPASRALFDVAGSKVVFEEDLFAQPGDEESIYTTDVAGFLAAQDAALQALKPPRGVTYVVVKDRPKMPKGAEEAWVDWRKARPKSTVYFWVETESQRALGDVRALITIPKAAPPPRDDAAEDAADEAQAAPKPPEAPKVPITKAGLEMITAAKTQALRDMLGTMTADDITPAMVIHCLVLLLSAPNVSVPGPAVAAVRELRSRIVHPFGAMMPAHEPEAVETGLCALAAVLSCAPPDAASKGYRTDSGDVAEWIGHLVNAGRSLPRFDTPEFLGHCQTGALVDAAQSAGLAPGKQAAKTRAMLEGNAPNWRPTAAQFGAPGPSPKREATADADAGDAEEGDDGQ